MTNMDAGSDRVVTFIAEVIDFCSWIADVFVESVVIHIIGPALASYRRNTSEVQFHREGNVSVPQQSQRQFNQPYTTFITQQSSNRINLTPWPSTQRNQASRPTRTCRRNPTSLSILDQVIRPTTRLLHSLLPHQPLKQTMLRHPPHLQRISKISRCVTQHSTTATLTYLQRVVRGESVRTLQRETLDGLSSVRVADYSCLALLVNSIDFANTLQSG